MDNIAASVRINADAGRILSDLAAKLARPKAQVIEIALRELEERTFWAGVQRSFEQTASDPVAMAEQKEESTIWERASEADFREEQW